MTTTSNLIVPVVLWGKQAPTHCISSVYLARDQKILATGCNDGQICIWDVDEGLKITPRSLLFGHTAPVQCLARGSSTNEGSYLVSSSENGEMCVWDLSDGRCMQNIKLDYIHAHIHSYVFSGASEVRLICDGYYAEILVMDAFSLEIVFTLSSRVSPDWISAMHILRPTKSQDDKVVALSVSGTIKVWSVNGNIAKGAQIFEQESKPIRCLNALTLTTCIYNQRTVLIVCSKYWQVFDGEDFGLLCSMDNRRSERWAGGDFVAVDRILVWSDLGKGYLYKLPSNEQRGIVSSCVVESDDFHSKGKELPFCYCTLKIFQDKEELLACPPAMSFSLSTRGHFQKLLLRGDCEGKVAIWTIPEATDKFLSHIQQGPGAQPPDECPETLYSLSQAWKSLNPPPPGILSQLDNPDGLSPKLTSSIFLPLQGTLVCGRDDGSIIIVSATQTVMLQLLYGKHQQHDDWPPHQVLLGHNGPVTCLLYPHHVHNRYDIAHLVSGGVDFSVCLWDIYSGSLLHTFCVHAGEITQLLVPPNNCSARVLQCICSVASDHSVALLGMKDRRCSMLASRHLFPVHVIKWRPLDDFMVVGCADGTVYIWQMETGHLDRVVHGLVAEEVLSACDENVANASARDAMANPAIHFFRGLKHRNLAAIRHAAARGLHHLAQTHQAAASDGVEAQKNHSSPLMIQGLKTNPKDYDSHVLFFDIEALIVQLLTEEYSTMSPSTLEAQGLISQSEFHKVSSFTQNSSPDTQRKLANLLSKVRDTAENMGQKIQATAESVGFKPQSPELNQLRRPNAADPKAGRRPNTISMVETNLTMEIAQLLLSFVHAWGLDVELDNVCENKLGLLRPMCPISFGLLSRGGFMSLLLPFWKCKAEDLYLTTEGSQSFRGVIGPRVRFDKTIPKELLELQYKTLNFVRNGHWEVSTALTTHHLLSIISIANTLMSMNSATFISEQERRRKLMRRLSRMDSKLKLPDVNKEQSGNEEDNSSEQLVQSRQAQIKQGWSLLAALHCVLLPDRIQSSFYKHPRVEMLVGRWQDRCLEVREAAQALLLAELRRMGIAGRKCLVEEWSPYLPNCFEPFSGTGGVTSSGASTPADVKQSMSSAAAKLDEAGHDLEEEDDDDSIQDDVTIRRTSSSVEAKRKQATAIVLLGVIGAEFGQDIETNRRKSSDEQARKSIVEGFGLTNYCLARHTSKALAFLLLAAPSPKLPLHTPLRRAAIDLIGRGFTVWEPYVDVSKILLGLLELCCESDKLVPSMTYGLPLAPAADSCRTARHSLSLIATARPPAFITTMAKEVARFNNLAQNAQMLNINLAATVLNRAKPEILRIVELLIDKMQSDVADLIIEVTDIVLHCLDHNIIKNKGLSETFPAICRYNVVTYCSQTRRIAVGARNGTLAIYELRPSKCQLIQAHAPAVTACSFSPDGKFLASYSSGENKLCFWQTATGLFGLGNSQIRLCRTFVTKPLPDSVKSNPLKMARLVWIANKTIVLLLSDGTEYRFSV